MFDVLAEMDVPWNAVQLFQVDERVAPDGDPDRNSSQLTAHLIRHVEIRRGAVNLMEVGARSLDRAAASYATRLGTAPLDIVHLGLGDDGHTASWPPGDPVIDDPRLVGISAAYRGRVRMTLTPIVVNAARSRLVLAAGPEKAAPVARWLRGANDLPIARVRRTGTTLVLDTAAAADLPQG
jgi:6-phosphogluconolactonase/glucosamine-6-phosphate isomerase/deaminase